MKQKFALVFFITNFFPSFSQEQYAYSFEKITDIATISDKQIVHSLLRDAEIFDGTFFISYFGNERTPLLYKKEKNLYLSYNLDFSNQTNYTIIGQSQNKKYLYISGTGSHSARQTEFGFKHFYIIDLATNHFATFQYYSSIVYWEADENDLSGLISTTGYSINSANILLQNDRITILTDFFTNAEGEGIDYDVIRSGEYVIKKSELKKEQYYDAKSMTFKPIRYAGKIAIGMTLQDLNAAYPYSSFVEAQNTYATCADDNAIGFEIYDGNDLLGFVPNAISENRILGLVILSPKLIFGNISTNSTAKEVLKLYPKSNIRIDLLSDWEHVYIAELNLELVFKTTENDRIAYYKNEAFIKLKNGEAKPDFIEMAR